MNILQLFTLALLVWSACEASGQRIGQPLPDWQKGQLDIHHINTGRGNATFIILPDGTTLLIDAGSVNPIDWRTNAPRNLPIKPNGDRQAGEWIARYIQKTMSFRSDPVIDYAVLTHFHDDHMGSPLHMVKKSVGGYVLTGITEVGDLLSIRKVLDRGWPEYNYPRSFATDSMVNNYRRFLDWQVRTKHLQVEQFQAGRNDQIVLLKQPDRYKNIFKVRNIAVNGNIWTGSKSATQSHFPALTSLPPIHMPNENMCSIALCIQYGKFDYFSGGDIQGVLQFGMPKWHDIETPIAKVVGPVDVYLLDHHGYEDSQNGTLLASLRPRVLVIPAWHDSHPGRAALERIYSEQIYTGERDVFTTNLLDSTKVTIGELAERLKSTAGHVVIRVEPGGDKYSVLIIDDNDESLRVKAIHGPYQVR